MRPTQHAIGRFNISGDDVLLLVSCSLGTQGPAGRFVLPLFLKARNAHDRHS